jgi:putative membrane protein
MNRHIILSVSALALALAGCGKKEDSSDAAMGDASTSAMASDAAMSSDAAMAPAASPGQAFANAAAASDMFEIETSKLAADKSSAAKVKSFAQNMIKMHTTSTADLKTAASAASPAITPDPALTAMQQQTLDALKTKSGAEFDTAYAKAQVNGHQMTLDALKAYSMTGDVPSLKALAAKMVPVVTGHLNMAKGL